MKTTGAAIQTPDEETARAAVDGTPFSLTAAATAGLAFAVSYAAPRLGHAMAFEDGRIAAAGAARRRRQSMMDALPAQLAILDERGAIIAVQMLRLQDEERRGIARELHDGAGTRPSGSSARPGVCGWRSLTRE